MPKLKIGTLDTLLQHQVASSYFKSLMKEAVVGQEGADVILEFYSGFERTLRNVSGAFQKFLKEDDPDGLETITGRVKFIVASLKILKTCGEVSGTTDGLCREIALICMGHIYSQVEGLKDSLDHTRMQDPATFDEVDPDWNPGP
jgi:hypothetical protein